MLARLLIRGLALVTSLAVPHRTGVAAVLASGVGDNDRLFLEGGSYGGYLTSWIITHDHRFKRAVAAVPAPICCSMTTRRRDAQIVQLGSLSTRV